MFGMTETQIALYNLALKDATAEQMEAASATLADIEQKTALKEILEDIKDPYEDFADKISTANMLLATGSLSVEKYTLYMGKLSKEIAKLAEEEKDQFEELKQAIEGWGKNSADAIVEFCTTGKESFSDMINAMIKDLMRMLIYQNVTKPLFGMIAGSVSGGGGGLLSGIGGFIGGIFGGGKAGGGSVSPGKMYEVNETGLPELLNVGNRQFLMMSSRAGKVIPMDEGGGKPGMGNISINVPLTIEGQSDKALASELRYEIEQTCLRVIKRHT